MFRSRTNFAFLTADHLEVAKSNPLDIKGQKGLLDGRTGQNLELVLSRVPFQKVIGLRATVSSGMEIDFCYPLRKVFQETEDEVKVHVTTVIHAKDKVIRVDTCAAGTAF